MIHTYEEALEWIHGRLKLGIKPGLKRMEWMMEKLDHPERRLKAVHVGGTNGKGSTVEMIRSILQEAGYHVGTFTSPYIEQFNERISVNGKPISNEEIVQLTNVIKPWRKNWKIQNGVVHQNLKSLRRWLFIILPKSARFL